MSCNVRNQSIFTRLETEYEMQTGEEIENCTWARVDMEFLFEPTSENKGRGGYRVEH